MVQDYLSGFANDFASEAVAGALPTGQNSPQRVPYGLYAEQISGAAFTAPRGENRRSWLYRLRPTVGHPRFGPYGGAPLIRSGPFDEAEAGPNRLRWDPLPPSEKPTDFVDGLATYAGSGAPADASGMGVHLYRADIPMTGKVFSNADGELLILPQEGALAIDTELGRLSVSPGEIAVVPRGVKFRVGVAGPSRGYVCENYGALFRLPELGPIGSNGLANPRDFLTPCAWYEDVETPTQWVQKYQGRMWSTELAWSPLDVVAWHGNFAPYKYDLANFNTIGTVSFDHPDPSIFTVLTSPTDTPGTANCDFVIFPPRWMVAEHTFRPPWFHRNIMSEFMGLITGAYDAKLGGFVPGGASLHNCISHHGPDRSTYEIAIQAQNPPHKIDGTMAFMFEGRRPLQPTRFALESSHLQSDYDDCWSGFTKAQLPV